MKCSENGCYSKYFDYSAWCMGNSCEIRASRLASESAQMDGDYYYLAMEINSGGQENVWSKRINPEMSKIGQKMALQLQSQGWKCPDC